MPPRKRGHDGGGGSSPPPVRRLTFSPAPLPLPVPPPPPPPPPPRPADPGPWELPHGLVVRRCLIHSDDDDGYTHYLVRARDCRDLVSLGDFVAAEERLGAPCNLNATALMRLRAPLQRLLDMGHTGALAEVQRAVFELVVYHLQRLHGAEGDMLHTVVYGSPGVGKTRLIGVLAEVYAAIGVLRNGNVVFARRADLIGQFLGQTAIKTRDVIASAAGGVLVIDEAYSLGQEEGGRDIYATECVNTLNQALSEQRADFICIIAGYKDAIDRHFFRLNPGLERRFTQRFTLPDCDAPALARIFRAKVREATWTLAGDGVGDEAFFREHKRYFAFNGGDVETLFARVKMAHAVRVFSLPRREKRCLSQEDFDAGFASFCALDNVKRRVEEGDGGPCAHMYL